MKTRSLVVGLALVTAGFTLAANGVQAADGTGCLTPLDISFVLDRSGSMSGDPIETARDGASELARSLSDVEQSGLVSYSSSATLDQPLGFDHEATATAIESLTAGGGTATGDAIDLAHDDIQTNARAGVDDVMILLTDGITNEGSDPVVQAQAAKDDGVEIYAIGLGSGINTQDLQQIASDPTEEHFFHPTSTEELLEVFQTLTQRLGQAATGEAHALRGQGSADSGDRVIVDPVSQAKSPPDETRSRAQTVVPAGPYTVEMNLVEDASQADTSNERTSATSTARISSLEIRNETTTLVAADTLQARAHSQATPAGAQTSDDGTRLAGLEILGETVEATVPPNTVVPISEDTQIVLNEQITDEAEDYASLRVNLVHLTTELPDGGSLELVVSSAYAAAECDSPRAVTSLADAADPPIRYEGPDEETTYEEATVNRGGCASNTVAVSGSGCAAGAAALSAFGPADSPLGVAVSGTDESQANTGAAVSGFGPSNAGVGVAISGTDSATAPVGAAVSGTGPAEGAAAASGTGDAVGVAAVSGTGDTTGLVLFSLTGECNEMACYDVQPTNDAHAWTLALAGDGSARTHVGASVAGTGTASNEIAGAAVSGTGPATSPIGAAVSGTGPAEAGLGAAASGTNDASGVAAVSGTGDTEGLVLFSATGDCSDRDCYEINPTGEADAWTMAVSATDPSTAAVGVAVTGTDDARTDTGVAASGTDSAYAGTGVGVSGCTGVQFDLILIGGSQPSPVPVCAIP
ncbi:hypothetical protein BRD56_11750 [Thermoplasmatales archaeon SW_10_69_26]|nr:MAG: hypothetical protein BRD56_11750 [Thermoplasmatales archaeon SW_10_69_26]